MNLHHDLQHDLARAEIASRLEHVRYASHVRAVRETRPPRHRFGSPTAWRRPTSSGGS
jgi:hypothetical protein